MNRIAGDHLPLWIRAEAEGLEGLIEIDPGARIPLIPRHIFKAYTDFQATFMVRQINRLCDSQSRHALPGDSLATVFRSSQRVEKAAGYRFLHPIQPKHLPFGALWNNHRGLNYEGARSDRASFLCG